MCGVTVRPQPSPPRPHHRGEGVALGDMLEGQAHIASMLSLPP